MPERVRDRFEVAVLEQLQRGRDREGAEMKALCFLLLAGCAIGQQRTDPQTNSDAAPEAEPPVNFSDGGISGDADVGCAIEAKLVYVVDGSQNLYSFDPKALKFSPVGALSCASVPTFSMAVDRKATAYSLDVKGALVRYDIRSKECTVLPFPVAQHGFFTFGMGFASNSKGSSQETLFVASANSLGLATIDTITLALVPVGKFDKLGGRVELSGTGDGQLFGLFETTPYVVGEIDKATAQVLSQAPQMPTGQANFAFAHWGGSFWLFVGKDVFRFDPKTQASAKVASAAFDVVGAGVSTCAPTLPPN